MSELEKMPPPGADAPEGEAERRAAADDLVKLTEELGLYPEAAVADMRYEDEDADKVARVFVRVEWANGKIREYEAEEPEGFQINDPERDFTLAPMRMAVQAPGSPLVPMLAATAKVDLSFRVRFQSNPRKALQIRTERTASPRATPAAPPTPQEPAATPPVLLGSLCRDPSEDPPPPSA